MVEAILNTATTLAQCEHNVVRLLIVDWGIPEILIMTSKIQDDGNVVLILLKPLYYCHFYLMT